MYIYTYIYIYIYVANTFSLMEISKIVFLMLKCLTTVKKSNTISRRSTFIHKVLDSFANNEIVKPILLKLRNFVISVQ